MTPEDTAMVVTAGWGGRDSNRLQGPAHRLGSGRASGFSPFSRSNVLTLQLFHSLPPEVLASLSGQQPHDLRWIIPPNISFENEMQIILCSKDIKFCIWHLQIQWVSFSGLYILWNCLYNIVSSYEILHFRLRTVSGILFWVS